MTELSGFRAKGPGLYTPCQPIKQGSVFQEEVIIVEEQLISSERQCCVCWGRVLAIGILSSSFQKWISRRSG